MGPAVFLSALLTVILGLATCAVWGFFSAAFRGGQPRPEAPPAPAAVAALLAFAGVPVSPRRREADKGEGKLLCGSSVVPDDAKRARGGEDAFFISKDRKAVGVADGVGGVAQLGIDPAAFAQYLMEACRAVFDGGPEPGIIERSDDGIENIFTPGPPIPHRRSLGGRLEASQETVKEPGSSPSLRAMAHAHDLAIRHGPRGSSTICVACLQDEEQIVSLECPPLASDSEGTDSAAQDSEVEEQAPTPPRAETTAKRCMSLDVANLGDSGCVVLRRDPETQRFGPLFRTQDMLHTFNCPFQFAKLGRNGQEQFGDGPGEAKLYKVQVRRGDLVLLATDGLFDNLWETDISGICDSFLSPLDAEEVNNTAALLEKRTDEAEDALDEVRRLVGLPVKAADPVEIAEALTDAAYARAANHRWRLCLRRGCKEGDVVPSDQSTPWSSRMPPEVTKRSLFRTQVVRQWVGGKPDDITAVCAWVT